MNSRRRRSTTTSDDGTGARLTIDLGHEPVQRALGVHVGVPAHADRKPRLVAFARGVELAALTTGVTDMTMAPS